jgi:hypothetical protein
MWRNHGLICPSLLDKPSINTDILDKLVWNVYSENYEENSSQRDTCGDSKLKQIEIIDFCLLSN